MPMRSPPHPGHFLRDEIVDAHGLTVTAAAKALGVTRPALSNLLNGHAALSPEMALRFEKAFGFRADTLLAMQLAYDIAAMRRQAPAIHVEPFSGALAHA